MKAKQIIIVLIFIANNILLINTVYHWKVSSIKAEFEKQDLYSQRYLVKSNTELAVLAFKSDNYNSNEKQ